MALHGALVRLLHHRHLLAAGTASSAVGGWRLRAELGRSRCLSEDLRCSKCGERHGGEQSGFHGGLHSGELQVLPGLTFPWG